MESVNLGDLRETQAIARVDTLASQDGVNRSAGSLGSRRSLPVACLCRTADES
jgi:hypothetical protein